MAELTLYANPYDITAPGFYFNDFDEYEKKAEAAGVEEFEIQFIDGDDIEQMLFRAMRVNQGNIEEYFDATYDFDEDDATRIAILMEDMNYDFDDAMDRKDDLIVYGEFDSDKDFAYEYIDSIGSLEDALGDNIQSYFDYESFGRDVRLETYDEEDLERYEDMSDEEIGEELADDLGWEGIGKRNLETYFDWDKFARDLMFDMSSYGKVYYDPNSI